jgi:thiol:disulfide interchange protein DsbC
MKLFSYKSKERKSIARIVAGLVFVVVFPFVSPVMAGETEDISTIKKVLGALMPQAQADSIKPAGFPGMYEAIYGSQIIYISSDGRYMLEGDLYDLKNRTNLTEGKRRVGRAKVVADMDEKDMVVFAPKKEMIKHTITAFTDIDCGYCRKLHKQIKDYNDLGIAIRYAAYPRSGVNTPSYFKAVSVWCADDRKTAMTKSKAGETLPRADCKNPVKDQMEAAKLVGVTGTPTLVLEGGRVIPGYVEPKRLLKILQQFEGEG